MLAGDVAAAADVTVCLITEMPEHSHRDVIPVADKFECFDLFA